MVTATPDYGEGGGVTEYKFTATADFPFSGSRWGTINVQLTAFSAEANGHKDNVTIPASFQGTPVTTLHEGLFNGDNTLNTVFIENGDVWIAETAFENSSVTTIYAPAGGKVETWCNGKKYSF